MKAIQTRFLPFTSTKPARIKASAGGVPSITASVESLRLAGNGLDDPHITAAKALCRKYDWPETLASGVLPGGDWCHCFGVTEEQYKNDLAEVEARAADFERQLDRALH